MGPSAIRYANLSSKLESLGYRVQDLGNINVPTPEMHDGEVNHGLRYLREVAQLSQTLADMVKNVIEEGHLPIVLGGDHSVAIGSLAGLSQTNPNYGVIWFDAHGDMNTPETTPTGNIHGMPLAVSLGYGHPDLTSIGGFIGKVKPQNVVLVCIRSIDREEAELIRKTGVKCFTMAEIDMRGMATVMSEAIEIAAAGTDGIHLSLDLDALDPMFAPGVGTPVNGGVTYREGHLAMELLANSGKLQSVDVVEVNPILDKQNQTARMAVELLESLFGKTVI